MTDRSKRAPRDEQRDEFDRKYRDWHATRAAAYDPDLSEDNKSWTRGLTHTTPRKPP